VKIRIASAIFTRKKIVRHTTRTEFAPISLTGEVAQVILCATWGRFVNSSRSFVWLVVLGVVALFTLAAPDVTDTAFNETESPLTVSFAALPQARLGLPILPVNQLSGEFRNSPKPLTHRVRYGNEQNRARTPDLQRLLCVFLI